MKTAYPVLVVGALMLMASCSVRRPETHVLECHRLPEPLSVASGAVSVECAARAGATSDLDCTIRDSSGVPVKKGIFIFADRRQVLGFDPTDAKAYSSWDGCFVIALRDGGRLEEIEIISSHAGAYANSRSPR